MASRAKTATVAAALIRTAALEAIAVQWSGWMLESNRNINTKSQIKEGTSRLVPIYGAVGDAIYRASSVGIRVFSDNGKNYPAHPLYRASSVGIILTRKLNLDGQRDLR